MVGLQASCSCARGSALLSSVSPLAAALSDRLLSSRCAACFSPASTSPNHRCAGPCGGTIGYCSVSCMDLDLATHTQSGECCLFAILASFSSNEKCYSWRGSTYFPSLGGTCDLRAALRLYSHFEACGDVLPFLAWRKKEAQGCRLRGLLSNRCALLQENLTLQDECEAPEFGKSQKRLRLTMEVSERSLNAKGEDNDAEEVAEIAQELREAALLMCFARNSGRESCFKNYEENFLAEEIICQVFINGVQIHVDRFMDCNAMEMGAMPCLCLEELGSAVYGPLFSWINHSCRPNAFYWFALRDVSCDRNLLVDTSPSLLLPDMDIEHLNNIWGLELPLSNTTVPSSNRAQYGPKVFLQAIRDINKGEPVCISYTDPSLPKKARSMDLWRKYRFCCQCERCIECPPSYADAALVAFRRSSSCAILLEVQDMVQHGVAEFSQNDDPWACCQILEKALDKILHASLEHMPEDTQFSTLLLKDRLCLDIYTCLASSYRVATARMDCCDVQSDAINGSTGSSGYVLPNKASGNFNTKVVAHCYRASAGFYLITAVAMQEFAESGECGFLPATAWSWFHAGEALIRLVLELNKGSLYYILEQNGIICFQETWDLQHSTEHLDIVRCSVESIWPSLRAGSPFLSQIASPFGLSRLSSSESRNPCKQGDTSDASVCSLFKSSLCCLQFSSYIGSTCLGSHESFFKAAHSLGLLALEQLRSQADKVSEVNNDAGAERL